MQCVPHGVNSADRADMLDKLGIATGSNMTRYAICRGLVEL